MRFSNLVAGAIVGVVVLGAVGCSSPPRASKHEEGPMKLFVSARTVPGVPGVAMISTRAFVKLSFVSGPSNDLADIDRDMNTRLLQTPSLFVNLGERTPIFIGETRVEGGATWRTTLAMDRMSEELREEVQLENGYAAEVTCSSAGAGLLRLKVHAYVVGDGVVRFRGHHEVVVRDEQVVILKLTPVWH
jgi:hypothetical protein